MEKTKMKIVFLLARDPDTTIEKIIAEAGRENETAVISLRECSDYEGLVDEIENCDRIISW